MLGYLFALASSLFFSAYIVPRKLSKQTPLAFSFFMACGFSLGSVIIYVLFPNLHAHETVNPYLLWSVLAGVIWAISFVTFVTSIDIIGLSKSNQWKNLQGPIGALLSLLLFKEYTSTNPLYVVLAAGFVFISALFFTIPTPQDQKKIALKKGVVLALLSGVGFGSVAVLQKLVTIHVGIYLQQVVWSLTIVLSLMVIAIIKQKISELKNTDYKLSLIGGFLYLGASYFQLLSYKFIEASIGFTIIQMNALWTILIGILIFKEINLKVHGKRVAFGLVCALIGIGVLAFAKK